jgi:butyryl-CoA dehydrogenase
MAYRTVGMIDAALADVDKHAPNAAQEIQKRIEEYAVECSILKVWGSEMLGRVVDHGVQIFAGYGYVEEYPAERAYRDARINRIFEGTNEINRLIITGWVMKRAMGGQLALMPAIKKLMDEVLAGPVAREEREGELANEYGMLSNARKLTLFAAGAATQKYMQALAEQQEIMSALAEMIAEIYAVESCLLRAQKMLDAGGGSAAELAVTMSRIYAAQAMETLERCARRVLAAVAEGDALRTQLTILRRLVKYEPADTIALHRSVARRVVEAGKYTV